MGLAHVQAIVKRGGLHAVAPTNAHAAGGTPSPGDYHVCL